jgi:multidrug resistance protein, MATE family
VGAHQIAMNMVTLLFMIPLSVSLTMCVLASRSIGEGNIECELRYSATGVAFIAVCALLVSLLLLVFRTDLEALYTQDARVASVVGRLIILIALIVPL